jgi:hypothetical protein
VGLGWWRDVCNLKNVFYFIGLSQYFDQGSSFHLLFLRVACECNRPSLLATMNVIGLLFLRQCLCKLLPSTET